MEVIDMMRVQQDKGKASIQSLEIQAAKLGKGILSFTIPFHHYTLPHHYHITLLPPYCYLPIHHTLHYIFCLYHQ